jgi:hypothetical protein
MSRIAARTLLAAPRAVAAAASASASIATRAPAVSRGYLSLATTRHALPLRPIALQAQVRAKSTAAPNAWAKNPIVSYEELKPITEQPTDVSLGLVSGDWAGEQFYGG